ncbi:putative proteasomal ATPase-associated factor 1 [Trichinella spiralis]|uniref:Proteasomal ATPase-associated factor 1 n=1 Tax=Trichinella spiralis TaxID=6334 RepID=E5S1C8_TRISP|nr:putative proteasomal ATPase-associated factor 1 [Trichinella spiralis]KRY33310.1 Proteasomal ATPase-associated factor 1 [Trichinella spiralis]
MSAADRCSFQIQHDWLEATAHKEEKFWVNLKVKDMPTLYAYVYCHALQEDKSFPTSDERLQACLVEPDVLKVTYVPENFSCICYSSQKQFHPSKQLYSNVLDVTDGGLGLSTDRDGVLYVWETTGGMVRRRFEGHCLELTCARFFPSGLVILSGGLDMSCKIWSVELGECVRSFVGHRGSITGVGFVGVGKQVLSGSKDGTCRLWDVGQNVCIQEICKDDSPVTTMEAVYYSHLGRENDPMNGKIFAVGHSNGKFDCYDLQSTSKIAEMRLPYSVGVCEFLDDRKVLVSCEDQIRLFDLGKTDTPLWQCGYTGEVNSLKKWGAGFFAALSNGQVHYVGEHVGSLPDIQLLGPDHEPVYSVRVVDNIVFTSARDGIIRISRACLLFRLLLCLLFPLHFEQRILPNKYSQLLVACYMPVMNNVTFVQGERKSKGSYYLVALMLAYKLGNHSTLHWKILHPVVIILESSFVNSNVSALSILTGVVVNNA